MDRRDFLRRTSLALAGGLVVGQQVMEMYEQASLRDDLLDYMAMVNHKKVFALGAIPDREFIRVGDRDVYLLKSRKVFLGELHISGAVMRRLRHDPPLMQRLIDTADHVQRETGSPFLIANVGAPRTFTVTNA